MFGQAITRLFAAFLISASLWSATSYAAPPLIHFQGVLRDSTGEVVDDAVYALRFRIYDDSTDGAVLWETSGLVPLQTTNGVFGHLLGSSNELPDSLFASDALWVAVSVNSDPEMSPRTRLATVPFAVQAENADKLDGYDAADFFANPPGDSIPFRAFATVGTDGVVTLVAGPAANRVRLTSIVVEFQVQGSAVTIALLVGGSEVLHVVGGDFQWSAGGGAPIEIAPGQTIEALGTGSNGSVYVLLVGWEL